MYRMFTSNKDASPLCRAAGKGRAGAGDTCEVPAGLPGTARSSRQVTLAAAPHPPLIWPYLCWALGPHWVVVFRAKVERHRHLLGRPPQLVDSIANKHQVWLSSPALAGGHQSKVLPGCSPRSWRTWWGAVG